MTFIVLVLSFLTASSYVNGELGNLPTGLQGWTQMNVHYHFTEFAVFSWNSKPLAVGSSMPGLPWWLSGKESTCNAGDTTSIPGSGRPPGVGNGNPLQYSCLENPMDRGAWRATVHEVTKEWETVILVISAPILVPVGRRERRRGCGNRGEGPFHSENLSIPGARPAHTTSSKQQTWNHLGRHHKKPPGDHYVKQHHDFIGIQLFKTNFLILTWNQLL